MTNVNELTQLTNQEAILEEINEEELDGVVGGGLFTSLLDPTGNLVKNLGVILDIFTGQLSGGA
ncbi:hypothetical protein [Nostoc sp. DedQUE07]|uniref:hypothetical protein n=1 Tax=Nostoc sp. DedQUE07 TaxID=3075392 RepID=UPI002AD59D66|nr:hypothetical protein [Nostoc sp. DedQUE07]MDZ8130439.1 hypothetical protein [Nostoc sp. DedQUE07]